MTDVTITVDADEDEGGEGDEPEYDDWKLKHCCDVLTEAEEIKADPKLMEALGPHLEKKAKAYKSLDQMRAKAKRLPKDDGY